MLCGVIGNTPDFESGILGSSPSKAVRKSNYYFLNQQLSESTETLCPCDGTGIRAGLKILILWVRVPSRVLALAKLVVADFLATAR
jgi:hypothetical protein